MKKTTLLLASATLATISLTTSCSDYDNGFDEAMIRYNQNFIDRYGKIDPNHNWGFGEIGSVDEITGGGRFLTRSESNSDESNSDEHGSNVNLNELINANYTTGEIERKYSEDVVKIPGFPGEDGWYHVRIEGERGKVEHFKTEGEIVAAMQNREVGNGSLWPAGDVTNEEILYVSRYFREHKNPGSNIAVDWQNYFFQSISMDYDREIVGKGCHGNIKTKREVWFKDNDNNKPWELRTTETDVNFSTQYLQAKSANDAPFDYDNPGNNFEGWDEINNFNEGDYITNFGTGNNANLNPDNQNQADLHRFIMLFMGSGTQDFAYMGTMDHRWYNNWVLVPLDFTITQDPSKECDIHPGEKCSSHHYNGLYLAFDFEMHKFEIQNNNWLMSDYPADGYYSNWILKLSAANPLVDKAPEDYSKYRRIMCEDLGTTNDFDFNDLVFDVHYTGTNNDYTAHIKVQAAGGTLPIYIGEPLKESVEAHTVLGGKPNSDGKYSPIINKEGDYKDAKEIVISGLKDTDPNNIHIYVVDPTNEASRELTLPKTEKGQYEEKKDKNDAPQKICVPYGTKWTDEHQQIETLYPNFRKWVQQHEYMCWDDDDVHPDIDNPGDGTGSSGSQNTGLVWNNGETDKEITVNIGNYKRVSFYGRGEIDENIEYNHEYIEIIVNKDAKTLYVIGKKPCEKQTIKVNQTLTLYVTVESSSGGNAKYAELYGTPVGTYPTTNIPTGEQCNYSLECLIDVDKELPETGKIAISFIYEHDQELGINDNIGGLYFKTDGYERWEVSKEGLTIKGPELIDDSYNLITIECDVKEIRDKYKYKYLNCKMWNGVCQGAYWDYIVPSSAKHRTSKRR